jgi:hypothetical protein
MAEPFLSEIRTTSGAVPQDVSPRRASDSPSRMFWLRPLLRVVGHAVENGANRRRPPSRPAVCRRRGALVEFPRDLSEVLACLALCSDLGDEFSGQHSRSSRLRAVDVRSAGGSSHEGGESLQLVDRDELRTGSDFDRFDEGEYVTDKGRAADPECGGGLGARVREPLDASRLQDDNPRFGALRSGLDRRPRGADRLRRRHVALRLFPRPSQPPTSHRRIVQKLCSIWHLDASVSGLLSR